MVVLCKSKYTALFSPQGWLLLLPNRALQELRSSWMEGRCEELPTQSWTAEPSCCVPLHRHTGQYFLCTLCINCNLTLCTQIKSESFLEDINNILNSGDVPNIYPPEDLDKIFAEMKPVVQDLGLQPTKSNLFSAYTKRVRSNIHMVICMRYVSTSTCIWLFVEIHLCICYSSVYTEMLLLLTLSMVALVSFS